MNLKIPGAILPLCIFKHRGDNCLGGLLQPHSLFSILNVLFHYVSYECIAMGLLYPLIPSKFHPSSMTSLWHHNVSASPKLILSNARWFCAKKKQTNKQTKQNKRKQKYKTKENKIGKGNLFLLNINIVEAKIVTSIWLTCVQKNSHTQT